MHAAIGAARGRRGDLFSCNGSERRLEGVLDGAAAGLRLPAEEATAVVLESERDPDRT
jgi:hypothetical protein